MGSNNSKWKNVKLGDIAEYINGMAFKPRDWSSTGLPIVRIQNLNSPKSEYNYCNFPVKEKFIINNGDLLFAWSGTPGTSFGAHIWNGEKAVLNQHIFKVIFNEREINKYYFKLALNNTVNHFIANSHGSSGLAHIKKGEFERSIIPLPPLPEQHRIVAKLDSLFERIDRAIALVEQNITNAQHLMASVLNDALGGLDCNRIKLQDACIINPLKSEVRGMSDVEVSFLPMSDLNERQIDFVPKLTKKITEVYTGYTYFKNGDVLLAKVTPCFENGKSGLAEGLVNGIGFGSSEYYVLRAKDIVFPAYIYYNITNSDFLRLGAQNMSGAVGLKRVTKDFLFNYEIPLPNIAVQKNLVKYFGDQKMKVAELTTRLKDRLAELKALKSSLLDAAFKGEL